MTGLSTLHGATRPARRRAPLDPRIVVGVLLVVASVAGTSAVVLAADASVPVWAAARPIVPGQRIGPDDLVEVRMRAGGEEAYLRGDPGDGALVADRVVGAGELVPLSALSSDGGTGTAAVVVPTTEALPSAVRAGALVDVWVVPAATDGTQPAPAVAVHGAIVARIDDATGLVGGASRAVELVVNAADTAALLEATASGDRVALVPSGTVEP